MNIHIICLGSLKEEYLQFAQEDLLGKLMRKNRVKACQLSELREEPLPDNASEAMIQRALDREGRRIQEKLPRQGRVVCLDIQGKKADPNFFTKLPDTMEQHGEEELTFIIGGSHGISNGLKQSAQHRISFSSLTYPHQLFRIALLEALVLYL